jgi:hypothetical protein
MDRIAGNWKTLVGIVAAGAVLFYATLSVEAAKVTAAAPRGSVAAPASGGSGEPPSNDIPDFPQLD